MKKVKIEDKNLEIAKAYYERCKIVLQEEHPRLNMEESTRGLCRIGGSRNVMLYKTNEWVEVDNLNLLLAHLVYFSFNWSLILYVCAELQFPVLSSTLIQAAELMNDIDPVSLVDFLHKPDRYSQEEYAKLIEECITQANGMQRCVRANQYWLRAWLIAACLYNQTGFWERYEILRRKKQVEVKLQRVIQGYLSPPTTSVENCMSGRALEIFAHCHDDPVLVDTPSGSRKNKTLESVRKARFTRALNTALVVDQTFRGTYY